MITQQEYMEMKKQVYEVHQCAANIIEQYLAITDQWHGRDVKVVDIAPRESVAGVKIVTDDGIDIIDMPIELAFGVASPDEWLAELKARKEAKDAENRRQYEEREAAAEKKLYEKLRAKYG